VAACAEFLTTANSIRWNSVPFTLVESESASLYYSNAEDRWILEASDVTFEAPRTEFNAKDDDRRFPGLQEYFGDKPSTWEQEPSSDGPGTVHVSMECFDTELPTQEPTQQPTQQPTMAPVEICTALKLTVENDGGGTTAVTTYNGIYMKQTTLVNDKEWWKQRFTDAAPLLEIIGPAHAGRDLQPTSQRSTLAPSGYFDHTNLGLCVTE